jgi:tetratricopeptide (TPR) repeat protein
VWHEIFVFIKIYTHKVFYLYLMKKILLITACMALSFHLFAQIEDVDKLHENAKTFMRQGDYANASLILVRALQQAPNDHQIAKDLAYSYLLQKQYQKALDVVKPLLENQNADDQTYQIAGTLYSSLFQPKEAEKVYKNGLKLFPNSGPLYSEYGELLYNNRDNNSIKVWEQGIQADPSYSKNYYNASKYYYRSPDKIWSLLYGEIFINLESFTSRTTEIKNILLDGYKKLFADPDLLKDSRGKSKFEIAYLTTMNKQNSVVYSGINPQSLTMIRTRFILDWYNDYAAQFPFTLFDIQKNLLENGLFTAYDQWIFGATQNLAAFQNWISTHAEEYEKFNKYLKERNLKFPSGEYYH